MSQLRDTLLEIQKEKTLRLLLQADYDTATDAQKAHFLSIVGSQIEADVDNMLHQYVLNYQANTPTARKNNKLRWVYTVGNVVLALGSAYAVNKEEWIFVAVMGILMVVNQYLPFVYGKD